MNNHLTDKLYGKGKTEEDRYMADRERELIKKLRARAAQPDGSAAEESPPASSRE